jgi:hypothetical protein
MQGDEAAEEEEWRRVAEGEMRCQNMTTPRRHPATAAAIGARLSICVKYVCGA